MRKKLMPLCLSVAMILIHLLNPGYGLAEDASELHLYLGIPLKEATPEFVSEIMLAEKGVSFETANDVWSGYAYGIGEYGYQWNMQLDFNDDYTGVNRILLSSAQSARVDPDAFRDREQDDFIQFLDVEKRITEQYGKPELRFFYATNKQTGKSERYMFEGDAWEVKQMTDVCEKERSFQAFSIWGNVVLQAWADWKKPNVNGQFLSRIMLYYYPDLKTTGAMMKAPVARYPLRADD